jgi:hypothetical protein
MMKTSEEQFVNEITKGFWILPYRRREIRREIMDHLDDMAEEMHIKAWTEDLLTRHFGSAKKLKPLFVKGGLPMWAKLIKWGILFFAFIFVLLLVVDLGVLFFYKVDPDLVKLIEQDHPFLRSIKPGHSMLYTPKHKWLQPDDAVAQNTFKKFKETLRVFDNYDVRVAQIRQDYIEKRKQELLQLGQARPTPIPYSQPAGFMMPGPDGKPANLSLAQIEKMSKKMHEEMNQHQEEEYLLSSGDPPYVQPEMTEEEIKNLILAWTNVSDEDRLLFPRPAVTVEDIQRVQGLFASDPSEPVWPQDTNRWWLSAALSIMKMYPGKYSLEEAIQYAKDMYATQPYMLNLQRLYKLINDESRRMPSDQAAKVMEANARWLKLYLNAVDPDPEPLIDLLIIVALMGITKNGLETNIHRLEEVQTFKNALEEFRRIDLKRVASTWPDLDNPWKAQNYGIGDMAAGALSSFSFFRGQCNVMQWFCRKGSSSYHRYEALKYPNYLLQIALPNFWNAKYRMNIARSYQSQAGGLLLLSEMGSESVKSENFLARLQTIIDPFHEDGLRLQEEDECFTFRCAGPNRQFDSMLYDPSNGTLSRGDLVWKLGKSNSHGN